MWQKIKAVLPVWLKRIPWYLVHAPQRQEGVSYTLLLELRGGLAFIPHYFRGLLFPKLRPVSICTGIKNRTDNYLDFVLASVLKMEKQELIELSIFDCGSGDAERLETELRRQWKGKLIFHREEHDFSRSYSFNRAIEQASGPIIFASDADMSLPAGLVKLCNRYVSKKTVWFPICFNLKEGRPARISKENGEWFPVGKGMFAATKEQFEKAGKFNERFTTWGGEDWELWLRFFIAGLLPLRTKCRGLFHHYHPSLKPVGGHAKKDYSRL